MVHADSINRITEIKRIADVFKEKVYPNTSKELIVFSDLLKKDVLPQDYR